MACEYLIMAGTTVTVEDPDFVETKGVDGSGRVYLGGDYADATVRIVVETIEDESKAEDDDGS